MDCHRSEELSRPGEASYGENCRHLPQSADYTPGGILGDESPLVIKGIVPHTPKQADPQKYEIRIQHWCNIGARCPDVTPELDP